VAGFDYCGWPDRTDGRERLGVAQTICPANVVGRMVLYTTIFVRQHFSEKQSTDILRNIIGDDITQLIVALPY